MSLKNAEHIYITSSDNIPALYATENTPANDKVVHVKLFTPDSSFTWYIVEYDPEDRLAFAYCDSGRDAEWGYASIEELEGVRGRFGLPIERDLHFTPRTFGQVMGLTPDDPDDDPDDDELEDYPPQDDPDDEFPEIFNAPETDDDGLEDYPPQGDDVPPPPAPVYGAGDWVALIRPVNGIPYGTQGEVKEVAGYWPKYRVVFSGDRAAWCDAADLEAAVSGLTVASPPEPSHPAYGLKMKPVAAPKPVPLQEFPQAHIGRFGNNVYCYGLAAHRGIVVYLNIGGSRMVTESIKARLMGGGSIEFTDLQGNVRGYGGSESYMSFDSVVSESRFMSSIICHRGLYAPRWDEDEYAYFIGLGNQKLKLIYALKNIVNVPVFDYWADYAWQAGLEADLLTPIESHTAVDAYAVKIDPVEWTRWIAAGVSTGSININPLER